MGKTFITGATGHVGANLVRALVARGEDVRALVRRRADPALVGVELEQFEGALDDPGSMARGLAGCDRVYHLAAFVSLRPGARKEIFEVNVLGTKAVCEAALRSGVERLVFCSTLGTVGPAPGGGPSDETSSVNPFDIPLAYDLSKAIAELEVHRAIANGLDAIIVNPSGVVGPHDYKPSSLGRAIIDFATRRMPAYIPGAFEFVAMRDVVEGHLRAMDRGKSGQRYILSSAHHTLDEILGELESLSGVSRPRLRLPPSVMMPVAHLSSAFMGSFFPGTTPRFTPGTIRLLSSGMRASTRKAERDLGYTPTSVFAALREQYEWFRSRGALS